jgi:hypothetical protein
VEIGASVTIHFFGTHHVTIHAGADLEIWGPDFAGKAHIHVKVMKVSVDFTVDFGHSRQSPPALTWPQFKNSFLPKEIMAVTLRAGLIRTAPEGWIVNPKELSVAIETAIPIKRGAGDLFGIAPMDLKAAEFSKSSLTVTIMRETDDRTADFVLTPIVKSFPAALWGQHLDPNQQLNAAMISAVAGYELRPAVPAKPGATRNLQRQNFDYSIAGRHLPTDPAPPGSIDRTAAGGTLEHALKDSEAHARRMALLSALGVDAVHAVALSPTLAS